jgi:uncharacterized protein (TIGR03086 family)
MSQQISSSSSSSSSSVPPAADPRPLFFRAADQAVALIGAVGTGDLDRPTPCTEYDVRTLVGHLLTVLRRITTVAEGGEALSVPSVTTGVADAQLAATAVADAGRLADVWADDAVLDRPLTLPFGTMPGRGAALAYTQELTVHAWDLATALGRPELLDESLPTVLEPMARQFVPAEVRGGPVPFGPVIDVPAEAGPYARLVGWLGRDPNWVA